ncbi:MAG: [FeFe] hydrogenase H-cluster radical SAM maturase HydE [Lachnospiraceae bacterium]|nr:[FeFe] hydrogenase H-cluster radical SAM maturase HydE [Lachnospiraceae bacterium]
MNFTKQDLSNIHKFDDDMLKAVIEADNTIDKDLFELADEVRREYYDNKVYLRGLIEYTNYCKNDCYYCGIRCSNKNAKRYRITKDEILDVCKTGYDLGYRTFVLQGGEDSYYTDDMMCDIVSSIREMYEDCAITLSLGERSYESYKAFFDVGANRYLLRHETADNNHYSKLHPDRMSLDNRKKCLYNLKEIGYQVGSGFMVGSPYQTSDNLVSDLRFLQDLQPDMIGIGPFIRHQDTPFRDKENGTMELTLRMIAILRLLFPYSLLPSTTALGTINEGGREAGIKAGANVVMPNLTPIKYRGQYELYDDKIYTGEESAEGRKALEKRLEMIGYRVVTDRGDVNKLK